MQCSVQVTVELADEATVSEMEDAIQEAGWQAMRAALGQAVRGFEAAHAACPHCGGAQSQSQGTVTRRVLTRFGRVILSVRRQRCASCQRRFRPATGWLAGLAGGNVTPGLGQACAEVGAHWPYASAAQALHELSGAQVSHEELRRWTNRLGQQAAQAQQAEADDLLRLTAEQVRQERDAAARAERLGLPLPAPRPSLAPRTPDRLVVGLDGGWIPSRDQPGGMEGKVGVVATGAEPVGKRGRRRLTPRRYVATFGSDDEVGALSYAAAARLGGATAREQVVLGDGAAWIKTQADLHFPTAVGVLDWAHVERALHRAIRAACSGPAHRDQRRELHRTVPELLWRGDLDATLEALRALRPNVPNADPVRRLEQAIAYLDGQRAWLGDYAAWQTAGLPIGSGLIERAVALVINRRMKRQGMRWRRDNASAVVALRVQRLNASWSEDEVFDPLVA